MSLLDLFQNPEKRKGKAHLQNLFQVAMADGSMDDREYNFLITVAKRYGIPNQEVDKLKDSVARSGNSNFLKEKNSSKFEQLYELVKMMVIDNKINPSEMQMCKVFAKKIGFTANKVDELIDSVSQNILNGNSMDETRTRVAYLIKD